MNRDIVLQKLQFMLQCVERISEKISDRPARILEDKDIEEIVILNLQRAVQATIDIAASIIRDRGLPLPDATRGYFSSLEEAGVISAPIAEKLRQMVGFRNIAVHAHERNNLDIIVSICTDHLPDFLNFEREIRKNYLEPTLKTTLE